jgi:hypothetical protein
LFTTDKVTYWEVVKIIMVGLTSGAIAGVLFGWLTGYFFKSNFVKNATKIETEPDETVLLETAANHFKGVEAVGGKLHLTNKRLVFKSHKLNVQNHEYSLPVENVKNVERFRTLGLVNNGLLIVTNDNLKEKFVVEHVKEWVNQLTVIAENRSLPVT